MSTPSLEEIRVLIKSSIPLLRRENLLDDAVQSVALKYLEGRTESVTVLAQEYLCENPENFFPFMKGKDPVGFDSHGTIELLLDLENVLEGKDRLIAYMVFLGYTETEMRKELGYAQSGKIEIWKTLKPKRSALRN